MHEHIVCYLGTLKLSSPSRILIFLEYADRGSLRQFYQRKGALSEPQAANCTRQVLEGMIYLHKNGIAHRDVKCANCLLTKDGVVKLADFGASKKFESDSVVSGLKGTPHWMAPEVIKGTHMTTGWIKADVWSMGCTVVEMLTGKLPFSEYDNPMTAMYHIANGEQPPLPEDVKAKVSEALVAFISACCALNPTDRPEASQLKSLPFPARNKVPAKRKGSTKMSGEGFNSIPSKVGSDPVKDGSSLAHQTTKPTLNSTPSEALTEACPNPLTRDNSLAINQTTETSHRAEIVEGEFSLSEMRETDEKLRAMEKAKSAAVFNMNMKKVEDTLGNAVGIISTTGTGSNGSDTVQQEPAGVGPTDVSSLTATGKIAVSTLTADMTAVEEFAHYDSSGSSGGEDQEQELYLDDFEEGGGLSQDDDTRVNASDAGARAISFSAASSSAVGHEAHLGQLRFEDTVAADRAVNAQSMSLHTSSGENKEPNDRVEYVPTPKASHGGGAFKRPVNHPGRRDGSKPKTPSDIEVESGGHLKERVKPLYRQLSKQVIVLYLQKMILPHPIQTLKR